MRRPAERTDSGYVALSGEDDDATPPERPRTPLASRSNNDKTTARVVVVLACLALIAWASSSPLATGSGGRVPPPRQRRVPGVLNVHIVPHSHDDVGWLKTVDQYYTGANASIQHAAVRHILTSVVDALLADPTKTFVYAEMAFFARWWREQTPARRTQVRTLVAERRLEFVNGGWCMHDEATAHVADMLEQTTRGHAFIAREFGVAALPRVGWQLDPFGHSSTQATHLGSGVGFDAVFLGRASDGDIDARVRRRAMEFTWRGSDTLGAAADVKGMILSKYGNYGPPPGHCYDQACEDPLWQDDPSLEDYNVPEMVARFERAVAEQAGWFQGADANEKDGRGGDVMFTMGTDFTYGAAGYWYDQLDRLVRNVNERAGDRLRVFYSTPSAYLDAKLANPEMRWETKRGDFFPYGSYAHQYWTGYFTSRPTMKRFVRVAGQRLRAARALAVALAGSVAERDAARAIDALADAVATAQHHDAVSGTSKQHVANDYAARLSAGLAATDAAFAKLLDAATRDVSALDDRDGDADGATPFTLCPLLNVSSCAPTEDLNPGSTLAMVAFNPSASARVERVRVPVSDEAARGILRVVDARTNRTVPAAILPAPTPRAPLAGPATRQLALVAELPPFSATTFFLESIVAKPPIDDDRDGSDDQLDGAAVHARVVAGDASASASRSRSSDVEGKDPSAPLRLRFFVNGSVPVNVAVTMARYRSHSGDDGFSPSGAYVFRPAEQRAETLVPDPSSVVTVETSVVSETRVSYDGGWAHLTTRRWADASHAEIEWTVGPVPVDERRRVGSEIVVRYAAGLATRGAWATDANGRDMQTRERDRREDWTLNVTEPVAGNYYPCTSVVAAEDASAGMHVVLDRSQGAASLRDGEIETMVHRRVLRDDGLGVGEALNETRCGCRLCDCEGLTARGTHLLGVVETSENPGAYRALQRDAEHPTVWAFARAKDTASWLARRRAFVPFIRADATAKANASAKGTFAADADADADVGFPRNANVLSLEIWREGAECARGNCALVRVAHAFEGEGRPGWDATLSRPVTLDLSALFPGRVVARARETTLAGQRPARGADSRGTRRAVVTLEPMEIKAVVVVFEDR